MALRVTTPSRLHMALIDMHGGLGRVDGGVGLALSMPSLDMEARPRPLLRVTAGPRVHPDVRLHVLQAARRLRLPGHLHIRGACEPHIGLGSGTQASLAAALLLTRLHRERVPVRELASRVERGGTSGIGVAAFEHGGLLLDGGHSRKTKRGFFPSSASHAPPAPLLLRMEFPPWPIVLIRPHLPGTHGAPEVARFREWCPIPPGEVERVSRIVLMALLPAVREGDIGAFGESIDRLQRVGFKAREVAQHHPHVPRLMEAARRAGAAGCGMSSFGPLLYAPCATPAAARRVQRRMQGLLDQTTGGWTRVTRARNQGAKLYPSTRQG